MKKVLFLVLLLVSIAASAFAEKQEWIDKNYDFGQSKRILVGLNIPNNLKNGVTENQASEIFSEKLQKEVIDELAIHRYKFKSLAEIPNDILRFQGVDVIAMNQTDPQRARAIFSQHLGENFDLFLTVDLLMYDTGTQYQEGYFYNMPTNDTYVMSGTSGTGILNVQGQKQQYVPGGDVPVAYCAVKFSLADMHTGKNVWTRIDDRARANSRVFDNTTPKDLYERILGSFFSDYSTKLTEAAEKQVK